MSLRSLLARQNRQIPRYRATRNYFASMERPMQTTEPLRRKEKDYGERAQQFVSKMDAQARQNLPTIKPDTNEWRAWENYFRRHLGFYPFAMKHVVQQHLWGKTEAAMTVPTQWPEWFDTSYAAAA